MQNFLAGPGLVISLTVFFLGMTWRVAWYLRGLDWRLDRVAYKPYLKRGMKGAVQSVFAWLLPFGTHAWRKAPFFTAFTFLFHLGVILLPLFLAGHTVLMRSALGFSLPAIPQGLADFLTVGAIIGLAGLVIRRLTLPEVRILTTRSDWAVLALAGVPLVTGFLAAMLFGGYGFWLTLHMLSGEIMLIVAPFTKLSHIVLYFMSRGQIGMDFSIKRGGEFRGPAFPW
ncbi:MAG: hypothetical protein DELT_00566 [Desulfovibrio sp.]